MAGYGNYSYVIDSSFKPFSMQEMLVPFTAYKDAYEQTEAAYTDLSDKSDKFKYLSESLPEGSRARQIYEGYANDLASQADDLARNGLSMGNRRALTSLRRRYQGEIGRLDLADTALQEERKRRLSAKDPSSMLYATDNLSIDDFLDNNTPNLYNISSDDLYARGAAAGKAASSRIYSAGDEGSTLNGYYRKWVERNGYSPESINAFRENAAVIPELQRAADSILMERGVYDNLTGANLDRARQSVLNGIIDGAVYNEDVKPVQDQGRMSAAQAASYGLQREQRDFERAISGYEKVNGEWVYNPDKDQAVSKATAVAGAKKSSGSGSGSDTKSGTERVTQLKERTKISWKGNDPSESDDNFNNYTTERLPDDTKEHSGAITNYEELPEYAKRIADKLIGDGRAEFYQYYFRPFKSGGFWNDTKAELEIAPRDIVIDSASSGLSDLFGSFGDLYGDTE